MTSAYEVKYCRICGSENFHDFLSLGEMPLANDFIAETEIDRLEKRFPLTATVCRTCWLVQLKYLVAPALMFEEYRYIPSTAQTTVAHFERLTEDIVARFAPRAGETILEIGSNDGTLLEFFREKGFAVHGVEPATNLAQIARRNGLSTTAAFFTANLAERLKDLRPKVIVATNTMAHVHDLNDFCRGLRLMLPDDGVFVAEFPYLLDLLEKNEFDTIYHEHAAYFSLAPLITLFRAHDLELFDAVRLPVHGGSLRIFVAPSAHNLSRHEGLSRVESLRRDELAKGLGSLVTYNKFAQRVDRNCNNLRSLLISLKATGQKIAAYGAAAKGNILLNYCGIDRGLIDYVVDSIPFKQNCLTPGVCIPVLPESALATREPDYMLLLAWNYREEIFAKCTRFLSNGGRFIVPTPDVHVLGAELARPIYGASFTSLTL